MDTPTTANSTRREFLGTAGTAAAGALLASQIAARAHAASDDTLKVGLVGCGGRGSGALINALRADKNVKLTALADAFSDKLEDALGRFKKQKDLEGKIAPEVQKFVGFDAAKQLIDSGVDVVLLCEPPHFRPAHLKYAIEKGKHVFCEKPVAVDAPGVRSVMETAKLAKEKKLSLVSGLCWRYDAEKKGTLQKVLDGGVGEIRTMECNYITSGLKVFPRKDGWGDMEAQMRNWIYHTWLSGDIIVEQAIHSIDKMLWAMGDVPPARCWASGGRQVRTAQEYGHIYDHFNCVYEWDNGVKCYASSRHWAGCYGEVKDYIYGSTGTCDVFAHKITGATPWKYEGPKGDMYQVEHNELFSSIRSANPINNGDYMCKSTLMAIMGRMAAYTGARLTWDQMLNSKESLTPPKYDFAAPLEVAPVPRPGVTKFA